MDDVIYVECPNCGGSDFVDVGPGRQRCAYCGTLRRVRPEPESPARQLAVLAGHVDPATVSIAVTAVGTFVIPLPLLAAAAGLYLGYKALGETRAGGWNSEKMARAAVVIGWIGLAYQGLPLCAWFGYIGAASGWSLCEGLVDVLSCSVRGSP